MNTRSIAITLAIGTLLALAASPLRAVLDDAPAAPPTATPNPMGDTAPIVPLIVIKPGETQEMLMTSACMRFTRGSGPSVHQLGQYEFNAAQNCTVGGVTATFAHPEEGDDFPSLVEAGVKSCTLTVSASESAESGIIDLHLSDLTCGGSCHLDVRVLVVAAE